MNDTEDGMEREHYSTGEPGVKDEAELAAEREVLLKRRRNRQTGSKGSQKAWLMLAALAGGSLFLFYSIGGKNDVMRALGLISADAQKTSSVDMEVDREKSSTARLDFVVPPAPEPSKDKPVDAAWNERFKEIQNKLAEIERSKQSGASAADIKQMLSAYNDAVTKKLEEERKAIADENARVQMEAQRAEESRRLADEKARLSAADAKDRQKIEKMQRESNSVIVDERGSLAFDGREQGSQTEGEASDLDGNGRFLKSSASKVVETSVSQRLFDPSRMIVQGTIISAVLETAIDTQLPGNIRAQVMQPVYSFDGTRVLMPPGTMLVGQFNNRVDLAQKRVLIAWNRAITPDGKSIAMGSTGTDTLGRAGTLGNVDNRYGIKFGAAMLISAINAIPSALSRHGGSGNSSGSSGTTVNVGSQIGSNAGSDISDQASGIMEKYLSLPPIVRIPQGEEIRVFVNQDLLLR